MMNRNFEEYSVALLIICLLAAVIAQTLKGIVFSIKDKKISVAAFLTTGGMPSGHTTLVTTLSCSILVFNNFNINIYFVIAVVLSLIIIQDAVGLRMQASLHAVRINDLNNKIISIGEEPVQDKDLKELLGHKPKEMLAGLVLGMVITLIGCLITKIIMG